MTTWRAGDAPDDYALQSSDEVAASDRMELSPERKKMLMQANAERVLRL